MSVAARSGRSLGRDRKFPRGDRLNHVAGFSLPLLRAVLQLANVARFIVDASKRDIASYIVHGALLYIHEAFIHNSFTIRSRFRPRETNAFESFRYPCH
jgi:hypothetical protein